MIKDELFQSFPNKRIKATDGMAVTAEVWEEAHDYHHQQQRLHALLHHGTGIVTGLEVIASDPPDNSVYILPGVAVDSRGQTIIVSEPLAFDLGETDDLLYLLLTYSESRPRSAENGNVTEGLLYVHTQFGIEAVPTLPKQPYVELARIRRSQRGASVMNARIPSFPGLNEIDLRYRLEIGRSAREVVPVGICYLGGSAERRHGKGLVALARALGHSGTYQLAVDDGIALRPGLEQYRLLYLVGQQRAVNFTQDERATLQAYLQQGGTILMESCHQAVEGTDFPVDRSFRELAEALDRRLDPLTREHPLLAEPYLFAAPPAGYERQGKPEVLVADGVIFSSHDYGCLWQGECRAGIPTREEIRTAQEWGANLMCYAVERYKRVQQQAKEAPVATAVS